MTNITIPPEALEAMRAKLPPFFSESMARAACLAMLNAWPGVERIYRSEDEKLFTILLPLPTSPEGHGDSTEASDDA